MENLKREVRGIVSYNVRGMSADDKKAWLNDLSSHGCISGMVSQMIYYTETGKFTRKHRAAIMEMLADDLDAGNLDGEFIANKIKEGTFDNFLAWYAFEKIALENFEY
jgi:hypothetical protein